MWWQFKYLILALILSSCGFSPIHHKLENNQVNEFLSQIKIETDKSEIARELSNLLDNKFHNKGSDYILNIDIKNKTTPYSIIKGVANRYGISIKADYKLLDSTTNKLLTSGQVSAKSGFNLDDSEFINYEAENYTNHYNLKDISDQIHLRLTMYFLSKKYENSSK